MPININPTNTLTSLPVIGADDIYQFFKANPLCLSVPSILTTYDTETTILGTYVQS